jgi:hypothetical protein
VTVQVLFPPAVTHLPDLRPDPLINLRSNMGSIKLTATLLTASGDSTLHLHPTHLKMDDPAPLASLSLTHVHYDPTDPLSYLSAWLALVPQGLCIMYVTLIWSSREVEILMMFAGQMICEALNFALKRLIREERPKRKSHLPQVVLGRVVDGATAIC